MCHACGPAGRFGCAVWLHSGGICNWMSDMWDASRRGVRFGGAGARPVSAACFSLARGRLPAMSDQMSGRVHPGAEIARPGQPARGIRPSTRVPLLGVWTLAKTPRTPTSQAFSSCGGYHVCPVDREFMSLLPGARSRSGILAQESSLAPGVTPAPTGISQAEGRRSRCHPRQ